MTTPTLNADNAIVGTANAVGILIAPVGTAAPTDTTTAWGTGWETLGYIHEDGITLAVTTESESLKAWQSKSPLRTVITGKELTAEFTMLEVTPLALALFFDEAQPSGSEDTFSLTVTPEGQANQYAVGIDTRDGDNVLRYVFPKASLSENGEVSIAAAQFQGFPVTMKAMDSNGVLATILRGPATTPPPLGRTAEESGTTAATPGDGA